MTENEFEKRKLDAISRLLISKGYLPENQKLTDFSGFIFSSECSKCGGSCCKNSPCAFFSHDLVRPNDKDYILALLDTGIMCISKAMAAKKARFYLRPKGTLDEGKVIGLHDYGDYNPSKCILFRKDRGCMLSQLYRPTEGLLLTPSGKNCLNRIDGNDLLSSWKEEQNLLQELAGYKEFSISGLRRADENNVKQLELVLRDGY